MTGETFDLPFSPASERNKEPIRQVLAEILPATGTVLEIGAGTGQHAEHMAGAFPHLCWQSSDCGAYLPGLQRRIAHVQKQGGYDNLPPPLALDVTQDTWPTGSFAAAYSANTAHIMSWSMVCAMLSGVGRVLTASAPFALYGPFHYNGEHTARSNAEFDATLRQRDPAMGIRDALQVQQQASISGLTLTRDVSMPANNRMLIFYREPT